MRMSLRLPISSSPTWERLREIEQFWHLRLPTKVVVPLSNTVQWSTQYALSTILSTPCYVNIQPFCQHCIISIFNHSVNISISCYNNIHPILPCFPGSGTVCLFEQAHCHQTSLSLRKSHYSCYCTNTLPLLHVLLTLFAQAHCPRHPNICFLSCSVCHQISLLLQLSLEHLVS